MTTEDFLSASLAELAELSGISQGRWSLYINKKQSPRVDTLERIAARLDMQAVQLLKAIRLKSLKRGRPRSRRAA